MFSLWPFRTIEKYRVSPFSAILNISEVLPSIDLLVTPVISSNLSITGHSAFGDIVHYIMEHLS